MRNVLFKRIPILVLSVLTMAAWPIVPVSAQQAAEKEPNDEAKQANPLTLNEEIKGFVNEDGDADWYALTVPAPGLDILVIEVSGLPEIDLDLSLYEAPGSGDPLVSIDKNREGRGEKIVRMKQRPGKYFIGIEADGTNPNQPYTLRAGKPTASPASPGEVTEALRKALDYLVSKQTEEGYYDEDHVGKSGLAILALIGSNCTGQDYSRSIRAGLGYVQSHFDDGLLYDGGPQASWEAESDGMYTHAIATLAVIEALSELKETKLKPMAEQGIQVIIKSQNTEHKPADLDGPINQDEDSYGGWRYSPESTGSDISVTGWQILTLRAAKNVGFNVPDWCFELAAKYARSVYSEREHTFGYQSPGGESCARAGMGSLTLQLCEYPEDPCVAPALRFMQDHAPTWNLEEPGDGYPFYYWYYGTRAMLIAGGDDWRIWKDWTCRMLVDNQNSDGSWEGADSEADIGTIYTTALGAMMLEFCCGYRPAYMPKVAEIATLTVVFEKEAAPETAKNVEFVFDASNSMWGQIAGEAKITIARKVLAQIINGLPDSMNVGLRVYGHRYGLNDPKACTDTQLLVPIVPVAKGQLIDTVNKIQLKGKTPLVLSVLEAIKDFEQIPNGSIILITDGIESCNGDIKSIAPAIQSAGLELKVHIVGFDIKEKEARAELESIAKSTGGRYLDAKNAGDLLSALEQTLKLEYVVLNEKGEEAGRGVVGGEAVKLKEGTYTVRVLLSPVPLETKVTIKSGATETYTLKKAQDKWTLE
ncbi:MAG: VWA domain-containing protein [Candidatus Aminicenantales bacterium]